MLKEFQNWHAASFIGKQSQMVQILLWLCYGFIWIPVLFLIQRNDSGEKPPELEEQKSNEVTKKDTEKRGTNSKAAAIAVIVLLLVIGGIVVPLVENSALGNIPVAKDCTKIETSELKALKSSFEGTILLSEQQRELKTGSTKDVTYRTIAAGRNPGGEYELHVLLRTGSSDWANVIPYHFRKTSSGFEPMKISTNGETLWKGVLQGYKYPGR